MKQTPKSIPLIRLIRLMMPLFGGTLVLALLMAGAWQPAAAAPATANWWDEDFHYRIGITVPNDLYTRTHRPIELPVNFTTLFAATGGSQPLDPDSIRVVEVDGARAVLTSTTPFQFDPDPDYDAASNAAGILIFILEGTTAPATTRHFDLYFNEIGSGVGGITIPPQITTTDNISDAGQLSFRFETAAGDYYYHKEGGGFSSLVDNQGNDWIGYDPVGVPYTYRGIPNLGFNKFFHPGYTGDSGSTSVILSQGPLKTVISSTGFPSFAPSYRFSVMWEIYPESARMTVLEAADDYWFLYEGTPGGLLDSDDFLRLSTGLSTTLNSTFDMDIPGHEWVYFADPVVNRSLFAFHHTSDGLMDSYRPLLDSPGAADEMTVFGFGRDNIQFDDILTGSHSVSIGLIDSIDFQTIQTRLEDIHYPLTPTVGTVQTNIPLSHGVSFTAAGSDLSISWTPPAAGCVTSVTSSTVPYFEHGTGMLVAPAVTSPYIISDVLNNPTTYYQLESSGCSATAPLAESAEIGAFKFALVPGS